VSSSSEFESASPEEPEEQAALVQAEEALRGVEFIEGIQDLGGCEEVEPVQQRVPAADRHAVPAHHPLHPHSLELLDDFSDMSSLDNPDPKQILSGVTDEASFQAWAHRVTGSILTLTSKHLTTLQTDAPNDPVEDLVRTAISLAIHPYLGRGASNALLKGFDGWWNEAPAATKSSHVCNRKAKRRLSSLGLQGRARIG
jgi:hypothetical protein